MRVEPVMMVPVFVESLGRPGEGRQIHQIRGLRATLYDNPAVIRITQPGNFVPLITRQFRQAVGPLLGSPFDDRLYVPIN